MIFINSIFLRAQFLILTLTPFPIVSTLQTTQTPEFTCPKYGFFAFENNCKDYLQCDYKGSLGRRMTCRGNLFWNPKMKACDSKPPANCGMESSEDEDEAKMSRKRLAPPFDVGRISRDRLYELRRFVVKPALFKEFLGVIDQGCRRPDGHSAKAEKARRKIPKIYDHGMTLVGAWIVDGGGQLNEVWTIWQIRGLRERFEARRAASRGHAFKNSANWRSNRLGAMVQGEDSVLLKLLDDWELEFPSSNGTYELQVTRMKPDSQWARPFSTASRVKENVLKEYSGRALGIFFPLFGKLNRAYQLWQYKDLDSRNEGLQFLSKSSAFVSASRAVAPLETEEARYLLRSTKCSPMQ